MSRYLDINKDYVYVKNIYENGAPQNQSALDTKDREYGANKVYDDLVNALISEFNGEDGNPKKNVYFFSYDFRKSNSESAEKLNRYIEDVLKANPDYTQVDLVCHSMGGLVASKYVSAQGADKIHRIVTAGTPYEGAPKLFISSMTRDVTEKWYVDPLLVFAGLNRKTKTSFPGAAQLLPTKEYFESASTLFKYAKVKIRAKLADPRKPILLPEDVEYEEVFEYETMDLPYYNTLNGKIFRSNDVEAAARFHQEIKDVASGYNVLLGMENSYFITGGGQKTVTGVSFKIYEQFNKERIEIVPEYSDEGGRRTARGGV